MGELGQPLFMEAIGVWVGFTVTLLLFSLLLGENRLARLALHLLIGASLGYAALITWQEVLGPALVTPLLTDFQANRWLLAPLLLALLLIAAGAERILRPQPDVGSVAGWRRLLSALGAGPAALLIGLSLATLALGAIQGTLAPQALRAAAAGINPDDGPWALAAGVLTLLITTGALLQSRIVPARDLRQQPSWVHALLRGWMAIGQRGLWLLAGVLFARLMASRFSLLIARLDDLVSQVRMLGLWERPP